MRTRHWHLACLLLIQGTLHALQTQAPRSIEDCLPYPTFAQELKQVRDEQVASTPKIKIRRIAFKGNVGLSASELQRIARSLQKTTWDDGSDWLQEIQGRLADAWRRQGYFQQKVRVEERELAHNDQAIDAGLIVHVDAGRQYRLEEIHFLNGKQFPEEQMRQAFPIRGGDVFDTHKIQRGLEHLRKLYGDKGFINFTAAPDTQIDQKLRRISLNIDIEEGKQFRISSVKVVGLDSNLASRLLEQSKLRTGEIFSSSNLEEFFRRNKAVLPPDVIPEDDTQRIVNDAGGTVALQMNLVRFQGCPKLED
jgi:outer membrane protein insertion porin family